MSQTEHSLQQKKFAVGKNPYCVWEWDLSTRNLEFINGIDPNYFDHIVRLNAPLLDGNDKNYASLSIRIAYCHGLETLFALLLATIQAPDCVVGWLHKYQLGQLRGLVEGISKQNQTMQYKLRLDKVTWQGLSEVIHQFQIDDKEKALRIKQHFGKLWQRLGNEFVNEQLVAEYNNIKHGLRVRAGGFSLAFGRQDAPGIAAPSERMVSMGGSVFGSEFFKPEPIGGDHYKRDPNFRVRRMNLNWDPESLALRINLISSSLNNILSFLKIVNGVDPNTVAFSWPEDEKCFEAAWNNHFGVLNCSMDIKVEEENITRFSKKEILSTLNDSFKGNLSDKS